MKTRISLHWVFVVLLLICTVPVISQIGSGSMRVHAKKRNGKDVYYKQGQYVQIMSQTGQHYDSHTPRYSTTKGSQHWNRIKKAPLLKVHLKMFFIQILYRM